MAVSSSRGTSPLSVWLILLGCVEMDVLFTVPACDAGVTGGSIRDAVFGAPMVVTCSGDVGEFGVVRGSGAEVGAASRSWGRKACWVDCA
jgi:hypothetical protein